jgi:hypothetical protein
MYRTLLVTGALAAFVLGTLGAAPNRTAHSAQHAASNDPCASLPSRWQRSQCYAFHQSAPGDEYFGRLKMSYLGIDNTAHDVAIEAGAYSTDPALVTRLSFAADALHAWAQRYPGDPQLPRSYFLMIRALRKVYVRQDQQLAWTYMQHVVRAYPASYFARLLHADLSRGFTEHWFALPEICPTPLPTPNPREPRPTPSPTPVPTPVETETPTPPGQPHVDVITPPCVQPQPTPTPTPMPSPASSPPPMPEPEPT